MPKFELLFDEGDRATARVRLHRDLHGSQIILTKACTGPSEFSTVIDELKSELELVAKEARAKFNAYWRMKAK